MAESRRNNRLLPSNPEFLLEYMDLMPSDDSSDDDFDGYIDNPVIVADGYEPQPSSAMNSSFENYPSTSSFENYPSTSSFENNPSTSSFENNPSTSSFENYPSTSSFENYPSTSSFEYHPSTSFVDDFPSTRSVENYMYPSNNYASTSSTSMVLITTQPVTSMLHRYIYK